MKKQALCILAALAILGLAAQPAQAGPWNFEVFAGYFLPEELDEDLAYGLGFGKRGDGNWGWETRASWFDVADSQGFSGFDVDADVVHVDFSLEYFPGGGNFSIFFGPGFASGNVDVPGVTTDLSDDVFSAHVGLGYEFDATESFYIKPDFRARWYELEGFGRDGGKDSQLTYEAAVALGWRFGG
jgi:hypothetical protein